jgi:hypothetical protein
MRSLFFSTILGSVLLTSSLARADAWLINYTTVTGVSASLNVIATDTPVNGVFTVLAISGERDDYLVTGLSSYAGADQLLSPTDPYIGLAGVSFTTTDGNTYNLFDSNNVYSASEYGEDNYNGDPAGSGSSAGIVALSTLTVSNVPEPASLAMVGIGIIGVGAIRRKRAAI